METAEVMLLGLAVSVLTLWIIALFSDARREGKVPCCPECGSTDCHTSFRKGMKVVRICKDCRAEY